MQAASDNLVSIVVCTYNGEKYLRAQLESLIKQDYFNLEILVCDDASTDNTVDIANVFAQQHSQVKVIVNAKNLGYNANFESAFKKATGMFIAVSDQDDIWKPNKISTMLPLFHSKEVMLVYSQSVRFKTDPPNIHQLTTRKLFEGSDIRQLMFFNTVAGHNMIFRKELLSEIGVFPKDVFYDWWLLIAAAMHGTVKGTNDVLTFHRYHESNLTLGKKDERKQTRSKAEERLITINRIIATGRLSPEQKRFAEELQHALNDLQTKRFSWKLFQFLTRNSAIIFFFKKKSIFSKLKMAYRLSFAT